MKKNILIYVNLFLLFAVLLPAQQTERMAFEGPNGIFVNLGNEIPFPNPQTHFLFSYKIERSLAGSNAWNEIALIISPEDFNAFLSKIYELNLSLKDSIPASELPLKDIWEKAVQFERLDSMEYLGNPLIVRMALGITYLDKAVEKDKIYQYRISKIRNDGFIAESFITNEVAFPGKLENGPLKLLSKETNDRYIRLNWELSSGRNPARFILYRRENFIGDFIKTNPILIYNYINNALRISVIDTTVKSEQVYEYYILPVDYYQNEGNASEVITVPAFSYNKMFPPYNIVVDKADTLDGLKLTWKMDNSNMVVSFKIFRSLYYDSAFTEIGEVAGYDSVFIDLTAKPMTKYYYYLQLSDKFSEINLSSAKVFGIYKSSSIPKPPIIYEYETTEKGIKLRWYKPDDFVDKYIVYRNYTDELTLFEHAIINSADSIVEFFDTNFTTEGRMVFSYTVRAENTSGNMSDFSDTVSILPQRKILIRPPRDLVGYEMDKKVFLYWENMFEENDWVTGYKVFRKMKGTQEHFSALFDSLLSPKQNNYVDTTVKEGNIYEYSVKAYSLSDKESEFSLPLSIEIPSTPVLPPAGLTALSKDEGIYLFWDKPVQGNIKEFRIYRYERGEEPVMIATVKADEESEYIDSSAIKGRLYFYYITAVNQLNQESIPCEEIGLRR